MTSDYLFYAYNCGMKILVVASSCSVTPIHHRLFVLYFTYNTGCCCGHLVAKLG